MPRARIDRRIEQHQRLEAPSIFQRVQGSRHPRHRMKQPCRRHYPEFAIHRVQDGFQIFDKIRPAMSFRGVRRIVPVISKIEDHHFVPIAQQPPKRKVPVDCEPVAVTQDQPRSARLPVLTDVDNRAVGHLHVEGVPRACHMMYRLAFFHLDFFAYSIRTG